MKFSFNKKSFLRMEIVVNEVVKSTINGRIEIVDRKYE